MFNDIGLPEMLVLIVIAVIIFGPDKLPKVIQDTMAFIRKVRSFADNAKADIRKELGPEFQDFEFEDLNPKTFVRKNLLGDDLGLKEIRNGFDLDSLGLDDDPAPSPQRTAGGTVDMTKGGGGELKAGERPPYDPDAT
ncbi:sec-independent translocase [Peterkaempfera bronchialis]|uniref:Sec-independent protein translocase protein TatB n=1 Tax=Peterkaempfera bronchialis TaxID=2126346 RepID=A0A345T000_9ACTN|nr:sec-independent translocase [Peterkaempfera bronchialis]AXI79305.1 Sec-independent protein translocase subunit TatB [Peterkaempfera bronchialis]